MVSHLQKFLNEGGDPNSYTSEGKSQLWHYINDLECVKLLLKHGADPKQIAFMDYSDETPLELYLRRVYEPDVELVTLLVDHGANVSMCRVDHACLIPILVRRGVDINEKDVLGRSAVENAIRLCEDFLFTI